MHFLRGAMGSRTPCGRFAHGVRNGDDPNGRPALMRLGRDAPLRPAEGRSSGQAGSSRRLHLFERLAGDAECIDAARNAGIDRNLNQHFADLLLGDAVAQRAFDMEL